MRAVCSLWCFVAGTALAFARDPSLHSRALPELIGKTGVSGGIIVHLGCGDGRVTPDLAPTDRFIVRGLGMDSMRIRAATERTHDRGMPVSARTSFDLWDGKTLPFADNLINILVADDTNQVERAELLRVVAPLGFVFSRDGDGWQQFQKPWPRGMGEWPHANHGADGNAVTPDERVAPPGSLRWIGGPLWLKHHNHTVNFSSMVSAGGRLFYILDDSTPGTFGLKDNWQLIARDGFNGTVLWKRTMGKWGWPAWGEGERGGSRFDQPVDVMRRLVASGDSVYVALGTDQPVSRLDAATGEALATYVGSEGVSEILCDAGRLIVSVHRRGRNSALMSKSILVYDAGSGGLLWRRDHLAGAVTKIKALQRYTTLLMAVGDDAIYVVDGDAVACLELNDGKDRWRRGRPPKQDKPESYSKSMLVNQCTLVAHDGMLLMNQLKYVGHTAWLEASPSVLVAYSGRTGDVLWQVECGSWDYDSRGSFFVINDLVWTHAKGKFELIGIDPGTGKVVKRHSTREAMTTQHHHRCYSNKATSNYVLTGRRGIEYLDIRSGENWANHWIRGACRYGIMPANGLTYAPPDPCMCYASAKVNGLVALGGFQRYRDAGARSTKGKAYGLTRDEPVAGEDDWPTYRHDPERSGNAAAVPACLQPAWRRELGGRLSSVTVAAGKVFVACITTRTLLALHEETGSVLWRHTFPSPVDTPPTLYRGLAIVGSADGHVYALRASDGMLCWAFRAAPAPRLIAAFGQLESAWPIQGGVMVKGDSLYAAAGRSSFLDGGIHLCALAPETGKLLREHVVYSPDAQTGKMKYDPQLRYDMPMEAPGALSDVLVSHGEHLYMRHVKLDPTSLKPLLKTNISAAERTRFIKAQGGKPYRPGPQLASNAGLLDDSWFNQSFWTYANSGHSRLLVFDATRTFGFKAYGGKASRHTRSSFTVGKGKYVLFSEVSGTPGSGWQRPVPIRAQAMVSAGERVVVAGAPLVGTDATWAELGGATTGLLWVVSKSDGAPLSACALPASPVWDGMAVANDRVYAALKDGSVICLEKGEGPDVPPQAPPLTRTAPKRVSPPAAVQVAGNLAAGKRVTCSFPGKSTHGDARQVTDGRIDDHFGYGHPHLAWVQVDLEKPVDIGRLKVWHYYRDGRTYAANRIALSETGEFAGEETTVFDGDKAAAYAESSTGKVVSFKAVRARYIRNWLKGNDRNATSQWVEIQAFAP